MASPSADPVAVAVARTPFVLTAPAACPSAAELRTRIERRLGGSLDGAIHGIEIEITRTRGGFVATVDARAITLAEEVRTLRSRRCGSLVDAIAVVVARWAKQWRVEPATSQPIADPIANDANDAVAQAAADRHVAISLEDPPAEPALQTTPVRIRPPGRWGGGVHLLGISGVGALPQVNLGGELGGYVRRDDRFVQLAVGRWMPQDVEVRLDTLTVRAGWGPRHLPLRAWVTGEVGRIQGVVMTDAPAGSMPSAGADGVVDTFRWTAVGGGFGVAWPMAPTARLVGSVEVAVPLERQRVQLRGGTQLYPPSAVAARCAFGLELGWR